MTTNINEIAWGVEFETTMPGSDPTPIGPYHGGTQVSWLPSGWRSGARRQHYAGQARPQGMRVRQPEASRIRRAPGDSRKAIDEMTARGAKVNPSCGLHVTVEWNGDAPALARLISLVGNHEKAVFASTGYPPPRADHLHQADQTIPPTRRRPRPGAKRIATTC